MNISADSLFPGIDGIGRSVAELFNLVPALREEPAAPAEPGVPVGGDEKTPL